MVKHTLAISRLLLTNCLCVFDHFKEFFRISHQMQSIKKLFLKISQYLQESTCVGVPFDKNAGFQACNFIKKRLQLMCFLVYAAKFSGTPFSKNICVQLLLQFRSILEWKYDFDGKIWIALLSSRILTKKTSFRSSRLEVFCKKGVLSNFAKFTGKRLCQSLFYNEVAGLRP